MKLRVNLLLALLSLAFVASPGHAQRSTSGIPPEASEPAARAPEVSLSERWRAPFAVSSSGRVEPREPRQVTIIGADPAIAAGLSQRVQDSADDSTSSGSAAEADRRRPAADASIAAPADDPINADTRPTIHRVRPGETWSSIAARYGISAGTLERANPETDPRGIRVGQLIAIPDRSSDSPPGVVHVVERGETLWEIARRYDVSPERIREANGLREDDRLRPDQALVIPGLDAADPLRRGR